MQAVFWSKTAFWSLYYPRFQSVICIWFISQQSNQEVGEHGKT